MKAPAPLIYFALFLLLTSCVSAPDSARLAEEQARSEPAAEESEDTAVAGQEATAAGADSVGEKNSGTSADAAASAEASVAASAAASAAAEEPPAPIPAPVLGVTPRAPRVGETVTIKTQTDGYDAVSYDYGQGPVDSAEQVFQRFGTKVVSVLATKGRQTASAEITFTVTGTASLKLLSDTVQHDTTWKPLIPVQLEADGDFDSIIVYESRREIYNLEAQEEYVIPVPFEGTRLFSARLYHEGRRVADVAPVSITGLNAAPAKPTYDGPQFLTVAVGENVEFRVNAHDPNNNPVVYEVKFAPEGSEFDTETGLFTWVPSRSQRQLYLMSFFAYDIPFNLKSPFAQRGIIVQ